MAGIVFPNVAGTLAPLMQLDIAAERNALERDQARQEREAAPFISAALSGDKSALDKVATIHPATAMKLAPLLERLDASKQAKLKEDADFITRSGMAILNAPPEQQPQLYARVRQEAEASGRNVSQWPTTYDPGWVKFNVDKAMPVAEFYKRSGEGVTFAPPAGGGFKGQVGTDESGGNYNIPNAKGSGAYGKYQFMPETWATVAQANPQLNLPMNMRQATPQQQEAAMEALTRSNGQALQQAGVPATPANLYLAHRFGTGGATKFLSAPDQTPIASLFPANWVQQNPDLNTTVGQFKRGVQSRYGGIPAGREFDVAGGPTGPGPQGDAVPSGGPAGPSPAPQQALAPLKGLQLPPGARVALQGGVPIVKDGTVLYLDANGGWGAVPLPQRAPAKDPADKGLFGDSLTGRALTVLRTADPTSQDFAMAYAILSKPQVIPDGAGGQTVIQPMDLSMFPKPAYGAAGMPAPGGAPTPAGGPTPTPIPGGGTVQNIPGKGKALDNSARDDLTKASSGVLELTELVKSFDSTFGGFKLEALGEADNFRKRNMPDFLGGKDEKGQAQWWQRYQQFANLERNKLFGASLTDGEKAAFNAAMVNPGMKPEQITANLDRQREIAAKALSRIANSMVEGGYNKAAIEAATGMRLGDMPSPIGGVPQPPPPSATQSTPKPPAGAKATQGTYTGPDNAPISWAEIEATAKSRGMSTDEVIGRLGLKPTGMQ